MPELAEAPTSEESIVDTPAFGNLGEAFDLAFPTTAEPDNTRAAEPQAPAPAAKPEPKPAAAKPAADAHEVPESIFGEPEKPAEPKAEPSPDADEFKTPSNLSKEKAEAWEGLRGAYKTTKAEFAAQAVELTKLREQVKKSGDVEGSKARIAELEARNNELSDRIASVDLQAHPAFQDKFEKPRKQLLGHAANLLKTVDKDPTALEKAMALSGKQRIEALDNFFDDIESPTVRAKVATVVDQIDSIDEQKAAVLADAKGSYERLTNHSKAEQHRMAQEQTAKLSQVFDSAVEHLRDKVGFEVLKTVDGADWWNEQGKNAVAAARNLMFNNDNPEQMAAASVLAATSGIHRGLWLKERAQRVALAKELAEIKGAEPSLRGNSDRAPNDDGDDKLTFAERVARDSGLR